MKKLKIFPSESKCQLLLQSYKVVPLYTVIDNCQVTALELFEYFKSDEDKSFLESSRRHSDTGRYSIIGLDISLNFKAFGAEVIVVEGGKENRSLGNPFEALKQILRIRKSYKDENLPEFSGGAIGFLKYEALQYFEKLKINLSQSEVIVPDIFFNFYDTVLCLDHLSGKLFIISNVYANEAVVYQQALERIKNIAENLSKIESVTEADCLKKHRGVSDKEELLRQVSTLKSSFTLDTFKQGVEKVKEYIKAGDIFQANIAQRIELDCMGLDSFLLYKILSRVNPSPFACFLEFSQGEEKFSIVSSSPERLVKLSGNKVSTRPIAGTRPKHKDEASNSVQVAELFASPKEKAEHLMLVDLERNDLGRVCEYGSVKVSDFMVMEDYSHVHHIVSKVEGILRKDKDNLDLIAAVFPGGTITGAPKVRCMEIINEIEPVSRDIYTGSIGYIAYNGDIDFNIVIRSLFVYQGKGLFHVGAGIVADSDPEKEYLETLYKGEALIRAWGIAKETFK